MWGPLKQFQFVRTYWRVVECTRQTDNGVSWEMEITSEFSKIVLRDLVLVSRCCWNITTWKFLPASACSTNHVEVIAWLWRIIGVDSLHKFLKDIKRRQSAHTSSIKAKKVEFSALAWCWSTTRCRIRHYTRYDSLWSAILVETSSDEVAFVIAQNPVQGA